MTKASVGKSLSQWVSRDWPYILIAAIVFVIATCCACTFGMMNCPDEGMRFPVARFIYNHGALPLGPEDEIRSTTFGFSYAYTPYLPVLIGALFMKVVSLFTQNEWALLVAARMVSVLSVTGLVYVVCKIGKVAFGDRRSAVLCGVLVGFTPQVLFLGSYVNNDALGLLSVALMVYAWFLGCGKDGWTRPVEVMLAIAIAICSLSYYNDYGFILSSVIVYFASSVKQGRELKETLKGAGLITLIVLLAAGWFFVRNALIHNGDFVGTKSMYAAGEIYAVDDWKMSNRMTLARQGRSIWQGFMNPEFAPFGLIWPVYTLKSFFCYVGSMSFMLSPLAFKLYCAITLAAVVIAVAGLVVRVTNKGDDKSAKLGEGIPGIIVFGLILASLITIGLSVYYSYTIDYQPQGRYVIACIVPLAICMTAGCTFLSRLFTAKGWLRVWSDPRVWLCIAWLVLMVWCVWECFPPCVGPLEVVHEL